MAESNVDPDSWRPAPTPEDIPRTFDALCARFPLRPIRDRKQYDEACNICERLCGFDLAPEQEDYFGTLCALVCEWQDDHEEQLPPANPRSILEFMMDQHDLSAEKVGRILGSQDAAWVILNGYRHPSPSEARKLGKRFHVP